MERGTEYLTKTALWYAIEAFSTLSPRIKLLVHNVISSLILKLFCGMWHGCAADEPTLRDDDALRSKAIIPMVLFMHFV